MTTTEFTPTGPLAVYLYPAITVAAAIVAAADDARRHMRFLAGVTAAVGALVIFEMLLPEFEGLLSATVAA